MFTRVRIEPLPSQVKVVCSYNCATELLRCSKTWRVLLCIHLTRDINKKVLKKNRNRSCAQRILQGEVFTTQLSSQIAEEQTIWNDLMFLFKDKLMSDEVSNHLSFRHCVSALRFSSAKV